MKKPTSKEKLSLWKYRISSGKRRMEKNVTDWKECMSLFEPDFSEGGIKVPQLFGTYTAQLPSLFSQLPEINASPKKPEDIYNSFTMERIIEDIAETTDLYEQCLMAVYSSLLLGTGAVRIGYFAKTKPAYEEDSDDVVELLEKYITEQGNDATDESLEEYKNRLIAEEVIDYDSVFVDYIKIQNLFFDPEADNLEGCKYVMYKFVMTEDELQETFPKVDIGSISKENIYKPGDYEQETSFEIDNNNFPEHDKENNRYEVFEIWDKANRRHMIVCEGYDKFILDEEWPFEILQEYPFEIISLTPKLNSIYGIKELLLHKQAAKVIDDMTTRQEDNAQRIKSILAYEKGAIDEEQLEKLSDPGESKIIEVNDISRINLFQTPSMPQETYAVKEDMKRQIEGTAHVSAQMRQTSQPGKQTATEVGAITQAGNVLTFFKTRRIESFIERVVRKIIALVKENYDQPRIVKVDSTMEGRRFIEWTGADINEYTFSVKVGSAAHQDDALKLQQAMQFLGQVMQLQQIIPNPQPLLQELLTKIGTKHGISPETIRQAMTPQQQPMTPGQGQGQVMPGMTTDSGLNPPRVPNPQTTAPGINEPGNQLRAPQIQGNI